MSAFDPEPDRQCEYDPNDPTRLLTVEIVAVRLNVVPLTVRRLIDRGQLPVVRIGPRILRIRESDLEQFITEHTTPAIRSARTDRRGS